MTGCARCQAALLARTTCCLECGFDAVTEERPVSRQIAIDIVETTRVEVLEAILRACAPGRAEDVARVLKLGRFELAVEGRPRDIARLEASCLATGARARVSDVYSPGGSRLVWEWDGWIRTKMVVAAGLGAVALVASVPLVTAASAAVLLVLVRRAAHFVDLQIPIASANLEAAFRPVDEPLFARLRAARQRITSPAVVSLFRECASAFAEVAWVLRSDGAILADRGFRRLEVRLRDLVERACALAQAANDDDRVTEPSCGGLDAMSLLAAIRDRLVGLRPTLSDVCNADQSRRAVASALDAIADVDAAIDRTLGGAA
jgi:hypothetical protein